jgi:hypothetical protein
MIEHSCCTRVKDAKLCSAYIGNALTDARDLLEVGLHRLLTWHVPSNFAACGECKRRGLTFEHRVVTRLETT